MNKQIETMNKGKTEYRIHVQGKMQDEPETVFHTYKCSARPESKEEALRVAEDFTTIERFLVEEVTTITKSRMINL